MAIFFSIFKLPSRIRLTSWWRWLPYDMAEPVKRWTTSLRHLAKVPNPPLRRLVSYSLVSSSIALCTLVIPCDSGIQAGNAIGAIGVDVCDVHLPDRLG
jgi:hypothetical protein